jgi:intracellular septation protein
MTDQAKATKPEEMSWDELKPSLIKLALELGPLIIFFAVNTFGERWLESSPLLSSWFSQPIIFATAVFMVAMAVSLLLSWILLKRIAVMPLVTGIVVAVFGTLTLVFQDATFIKMKPTIVNLLFAVVLGGGLLAGRNFLQLLLGQAFQLTREGWRKLTYRWIGFFLAMAVLNEIVWRNFSEGAWASFKVFGILPITIIFAMMQVGLIQRYGLEKAGDPPAR